MVQVDLRLILGIALLLQVLFFANYFIRTENELSELRTLHSRYRGDVAFAASPRAPIPDAAPDIAVAGAGVSGDKLVAGRLDNVLQGLSGIKAAQAAEKAKLANEVKNVAGMDDAEDESTETGGGAQGVTDKLKWDLDAGADGHGKVKDGKIDHAGSQAFGSIRDSRKVMPTDVGLGPERPVALVEDSGREKNKQALRKRNVAPDEDGLGQEFRANDDDSNVKVGKDDEEWKPKSNKNKNAAAVMPGKMAQAVARFDFDAFWKDLTVMGLIPKQKNDHRATFLPDALPPKSTPRTFFLGDLRKDFTSSVSDAFNVLGLQRTENRNAFDVFWSKSFEVDQQDRYLDSRFTPRTLVNHIPGLRGYIGEKVPLAQTYQQCEKEFGPEACNFIAPAFMYPQQKKAFRKSFQAKHKKGEMWICKPANLFNGNHVYLIDPTQRNCPSKVKDITKWVVQKYISDVILWDNLKFDLRVWVLVTSVRPFRAYISQHAWVKTAVKPYDPSPKHFRDMCIHSTSPAAVGDDCVALFDSLPHMPPPSSAKKTFLKYLAPYGGWDDGEELEFYGDYSIWDNIERTCIATLLLVWPEIRYDNEQITYKGFDFRKFGFLSYDIILERDGSAIVEEVNTNGFFVGGKSAYAPAQRFTEQGLNMVGVRGYDRTSYEDEVSERIDAFCSLPAIIEYTDEEGCSDHDRDLLWDYEDEYHVRQNWKQAFPPIPASPLITPGARELTRQTFQDVRRFWHAGVPHEDGLLWNYQRVRDGLDPIDTRSPDWFHDMFPIIQ